MTDLILALAILTQWAVIALVARRARESAAVATSVLDTMLAHTSRCDRDRAAHMLSTLDKT